jgi:tight adherence protein C
MNIESLPTVFMVAAASGLTAVTVLCVRLAASLQHVPSIGRQLAWPLSWFWKPANLLAPLIRHCLTCGYRARLKRALSAQDLEVWSPEAWLGLRIAHGLSCAALVVLVAVVADARWLMASCIAFALGFGATGVWSQRNRVARDRRIARDLPAYLDLLTVCVESGATLTAGVRLVVDQAPVSPLRHYFERVLREVRAGIPRAQAFSQMAQLYNVASLNALATALVHAERSGMSLGAVLRAQAQQRIAERFARAEQLAMQAPVKLLGPLVLCIFPCTFVVLAVPIVTRLMEAFGS